MYPYNTIIPSLCFYFCFLSPRVRVYLLYDPCTYMYYCKSRFSFRSRAPLFAQNARVVWISLWRGRVVVYVFFFFFYFIRELSALPTYRETGEIFTKRNRVPATAACTREYRVAHHVLKLCTHHTCVVISLRIYHNILLLHVHTAYTLYNNI